MPFSSTLHFKFTKLPINSTICLLSFTPCKFRFFKKTQEVVTVVGYEIKRSKTLHITELWWQT